MLVTYFPVFRSLRDDAAEAGALLLLAVFLHAALQLLQVGGPEEVSTSLFVARRGSGRRREKPINPQFLLALRVPPSVNVAQA